MLDILHQLAANPLDNFKGILLIMVLIGIALKLAPKGISVAGHDAGQLFLLAALPLFFIDFATSAEYAAGELHKVLAEHNLFAYAPLADLVIALLNVAFGGLYIYALGVFRDGGGASTASLRYLGPTVAIMVAFLLLEDYTLTVVVSSLSGADQILSTVSALDTASPLVHIVLGTGIAWLTCWLTLRGRRDASKVTFVILFVYTALMVITFLALGVQTAQGVKTIADANGMMIPITPLPAADPSLPIGAIAGTVGNSILHGLVALTGLEAVSNGLQFIKDEDANYVRWGKKRLPKAEGLWNFLSGRVGVGRTIQFGFLFWGGLTTAFNSYFSNYFNVRDDVFGRTLVGNLAFIGLVPLGGYVLYFFRQMWSSLTLSFANMTAYEDIQSTAYRDGVRGILPVRLVYRAPNGNFPRPVLATFVVATVIMILVGGNTSAAIPFYGIGVFAPIAFMGFSVSRHLSATKPRGYKAGAIGSFTIACMSVFIFMSQIVGRFEEGGWIRLVTFSSLFITGHLILLSRGGERNEETARHLIHDVSRIEGTMAELLTWQTNMMQAYRQNLHSRLAHLRSNGQEPLAKSTPYPPYTINYDES
ncbi:MAG TPA: amino acid permease [Aggregatilineales bacterium]|nr:amino acid permease [Aggregatilineales bacterium]